ncbi:hypothetical protein Tco_0132354 [Tanacetum coccineum]
MALLPKCGALRDAVGKWDWVDIMVVYCKKSTEEDRIDAAVTTTKFSNENLWKDDKRLQKLRNMEMDAGISADQKERFTQTL